MTLVAGVIFAVLLLRQTLNLAIVVDGSIIVIGIATAQLGPIVSRRRESRKAPETGQTLKLEGGANFKGV